MLRTMEGDPRLASAFAALKQDAEREGLLGNGKDWQGAPRVVTYERAIARAGPAPGPEHLTRLLGRLVDVSREQEASTGSTRLPMAPWSLLRTGALALSEAHCAQWSATHRVALPLSREASVRQRPVGGPVAVLLGREVGHPLSRRMRSPRLLFGTPAEAALRVAASASQAGHRNATSASGVPRLTVNLDAPEGRSGGGDGGGGGGDGGGGGGGDGGGGGGGVAPQLLLCGVQVEVTAHGGGGASGRSRGGRPALQVVP